MQSPTRLGLLLVGALCCATAGRAAASGDVVNEYSKAAVAKALRAMEKDIRDGSTPAMELYIKGARGFRQLNSPDYPGNDVAYEYSAPGGAKLEGVLLSPVSGHVPLGGTLAQQRANADSYRKHNTSTIHLNGTQAGTAQHRGKYVVTIPIKAKLKPGQNSLTMQQRNSATGETAYPGGFASGRQINITVRAGRAPATRSRR